MSKIKPAEHRKVFVRNTEQPLEKTKITFQQNESESDEEAKSKSESKNQVADDDKHKISLDVPSLNSALKIKEHLIYLQNRCNLKSKNANAQAVFQDKALKHLNFPYHQKLYKDLIPLTVENPAPKSRTSIIREPNPPKDKEPVLADFVKLKPRPEYTYQVTNQKQEKTVGQNYDGHRLYKVISKWDSDYF